MPKNYVVKEGESTSGIAFARGLFPDTVWDDPGNAELNSTRDDMNSLMPGDVLVIPDKAIKEVEVATESKHQFRRKGVPAMLRMRIVKLNVDEAALDEAPESRPDEDLEAVYEDTDVFAEVTQGPRAACPYRLSIKGKTVEGQTDGDGMLEEFISPNTRFATLILDPGVEGETTMELSIGMPKPYDEVEGAKERLANLGYDCGERSGESSESLQFVLALFQSDNELEQTSELDSATLDKIKELHGS